MELAARDAGYASLSSFAKQAYAVPGALIGAGVGAGVGAMADADNRWRGAGVGAIAGAGIGGLAGHLHNPATWENAVAHAAPAKAAVPAKVAPKVEQAVAEKAPKAVPLPHYSGGTVAQRPNVNNKVSPNIPEANGLNRYLGAPTIGGDNVSAAIKKPAVYSTPDSYVSAARYQGEARAPQITPGSLEHIRGQKMTHMGEPSIPQSSAPPAQGPRPTSERTTSGVELRGSIPEGIRSRPGTPVFSPDPRTGQPIFMGTRQAG